MLLEDDAIINVLSLLTHREVAAFARTGHAVAEAVRRLSPVIFPNAAGSEGAIVPLGGGDHMVLRRLQAAMEHLSVAPLPTLQLNQLTLLVQFQSVTYGAATFDRDSNLYSPVTATTSLYSKWVVLDPLNFSPDGNKFHQLRVDLSHDEIPLHRSDWDSSASWLYGKPFPCMDPTDPSSYGMHPAGETELVLKLMLYRRDTHCAAVVYESGHGRTTNNADEGLEFEMGHLSNEVGSMWHLNGKERQATVQVYAFLQWRALEAGNLQTCPFDAMMLRFEYSWPTYNDPEIDDIEGLGTKSTTDMLVMLTHRLRWVPL
jgi:hypothetical protein